MHRVKAMADWLDTIPPDPPFHSRPEFRFYADLTDAEFDAVQALMRQRAEEALGEAGRLQAELDRRAANHDSEPPEAA
jgi:hypothetical protein